ncbi:MAG: hypothetical protein GQ533_10350 [Methanosarcinaceae archaeon]|nr:hypothetical protein [Methanosarcinaceae archaeon]
MGKIRISPKLDQKYGSVLLHVPEGENIYFDNEFDGVNAAVENYWESLTEAEQELLIVQTSNKKSYLPQIVENSMNN